MLLDQTPWTVPSSRYACTSPMSKQRVTEGDHAAAVVPGDGARGPVQDVAAGEEDGERRAAVERRRGLQPTGR